MSTHLDEQQQTTTRAMFSCCRTRELDSDFRTLTLPSPAPPHPPAYDKSTDTATSAAPASAPASHPASAAEVIRPDWGTLGSLVLVDGQHPQIFLRHPWRKHRRYHGKRSSLPLHDVTYHAAPGQPRHTTLRIDKDPQDRPILLHICGSLYRITRVDVALYTKQTPDPTPDPAPVTAAPEPEQPTPDPAPAPAEPEQPTPAPAPAPAPQCTHGGYAPYPPIDASMAGPWARDLELYDLRTTNPTEFERRTKAKGRTSVLN
jgi:hypothetical protein